jgi:hypothetical protein
MLTRINNYKISFYQYISTIIKIQLSHFYCKSWPYWGNINWEVPEVAFLVTWLYRECTITQMLWNELTKVIWRKSSYCQPLYSAAFDTFNGCSSLLMSRSSLLSRVWLSSDMPGPGKSEVENQCAELWLGLLHSECWALFVSDEKTGVRESKKS